VSARKIVIAASSAVALLLGTASAASAAQYWLNASHTVPTTHCYTGYGAGSYTDLLPTAPTGTTSKSFSGSALFGCTPAFPAGATIGAGPGSFDVWLTNTNKKPCTTPWFLLHNATPSNAGTAITGAGYDGNPYITVPANTKTPTKFTVNFNVDPTTLAPGDQLMLMLDIKTASGSCSNMTLYYGSTGTPSDLSLPTLAG
jgi:hypothetical protein